MLNLYQEHTGYWGLECIFRPNLNVYKKTDLSLRDVIQNKYKALM